jgi:uncharacterized membrane protein
MKQFKIIIAFVLLISSVIIFVSTFFISQSVQIILETGQEIITNSTNFFSLTKVLILAVSSFFTGAAITYLFYNSDNGDIARVFIRDNPKGAIFDAKEKQDLKFETVFPLLKHDERKVIKVLMDSNGEMLQNALVLSTGLSKVKITRELTSLEGKNLIVRERFGLTNKIKLVK